MMPQLAVIMDPIESIHVHKDSTFALMQEAQARGWSLFYLKLQDLYLEGGTVFGHGQYLHLHETQSPCYETLSDPESIALHTFDVALMRKDPPFNMNYLYATILLDLAKHKGLRVMNDPQSLRDINEKLFTGWFPQCCPPTLVTSQAAKLKSFLEEHKKIILKPLDSMGGQSIFFLKKDDPNFNVILETLTQKGQIPIMAQKFIPAIKKGDKRVLMIDGLAYPHALLRVPQGGDIRGNLVAGGQGKGCDLTEKEKMICKQVGPVLKSRGVLFAGLDMIGEQLTEINVTSPTCIREIDKAFDVNVSAKVLDAIERKIR